MSRSSHIRLMADYNQWMNAKLYQAASTMPAEELAADRKAYFGSILGTLNHVAAGDTHWLRRFAAHPSQHAALDPVRRMAPMARLDALLFPDFAQLRAYRTQLDAIIVAWAHALVEADLDRALVYTSRRGDAFEQDFFPVLMHFFNHQTHHRGQASTLLSQAGVEFDDTDLVLLIPNQAVA